MIQTFLSKNRVFLIGLLGAIAVSLQQFISEPMIDWKAIGFAVGMAGLSYIANQWRGQGVTLTGIIGTLAGVFVTNYNGGHVNVSQFILFAVIAILGAVAPPPKSQGYEKSSTIQSAKTEGVRIQNNIEKTPPPQL